MSRATYNITTDKLLVWFDDRLSADDYARAKRCRFVWYPGRKCFAATWNVAAADFILARNIEIEEDDTPDNVEARVERFAERAEDAEKSAESSADYLATRANTARRQQNAANAVERSLSEAEHWNRRIAASIRHATYKDRADVIARRIKKLEAEERKAKKDTTLGEASYRLDLSKYVKKDENGVDVINPETGRRVIDSEAVRVACAPAIARAERWAAHVAKRLVYERALLEAAGGIAVQSNKPQKGGAVLVSQFHDRWCEVIRAGSATVRVAAPASHWVDSTQIDVTRIHEIMTPEQFAVHRAAGYECVIVGDWERAQVERRQMEEASRKRMYELGVQK